MGNTKAVAYGNMEKIKEDIRIIWTNQPGYSQLTVAYCIWLVPFKPFSQYQNVIHKFYDYYTRASFYFSTSSRAMERSACSHEWCTCSLRLELIDVKYESIPLTEIETCT